MAATQPSSRVTVFERPRDEANVNIEQRLREKLKKAKSMP